MLANRGALLALGAFTPLTLEVRLGRDADLIGEMRDDSAGHLPTPVRESPVELERFQQDGETEPGCPCLVTQEFKLVWTERPTLGEFVGMPCPFHGLQECTRLHVGVAGLQLPLSEKPLKPDLEVTLGQNGVDSASSSTPRPKPGCR